MSCFLGKEEVERRTGQIQVEKRLKSNQESRRKEVMILLLGTGDPGKSTVLKQLKLNNGGDYCVANGLYFKGVVFTNIVQSTQGTLEAMDVSGISFGNSTADRHAWAIFSQRQKMTAQELFYRSLPRHQGCLGRCGCENVFFAVQRVPSV
ncbi:uncharacterized protein A1O5_05376 [Cladophialophora psammophila CBS 110553]|uniref:Guanine nucleotide-binding protein subunit alpha, other n=1 Tax=Cladophialophora psammophila CBS 110553 TaxID=1182543 RepID=W9WUD8_9EURO|nr:uncharacterized protein A1O5_05376 [Cladophialophora psammophila CBS 110553]EXJ71568.1 hypothetical protein A1O5_05376 [Cladophialophora psammophila CBS 110553]